MTYVKSPLYTLQYFRSDFYAWNAPAITYKEQCCYPQVFASVHRKHQKLGCIMLLLPFHQETHMQVKADREAGLDCAKVVCKLLEIIRGPTGNSGNIPGFTTP
jgi:hypothetical protein